MLQFYAGMFCLSEPVVSCYDQVMDYDKWVINNERVKIKPIYKMEPHPISPCGEEDFGYQTVKNSIRQIWNNTLVAPGKIEIYEP